MRNWRKREREANSVPSQPRQKRVCGVRWIPCRVKERGAGLQIIRDRITRHVASQYWIQGARHEASIPSLSRIRSVRQEQFYAALKKCGAWSVGLPLFFPVYADWKCEISRIYYELRNTKDWSFIFAQWSGPDQSTRQTGIHVEWKGKRGTTVPSSCACWIGARGKQYSPSYPRYMEVQGESKSEALNVPIFKNTRSDYKGTNQNQAGTKREAMGILCYVEVRGTKGRFAIHAL